MFKNMEQKFWFSKIWNKYLIYNTLKLQISKIFENLKTLKCRIGENKILTLGNFNREFIIWDLALGIFWKQFLD